MRIGKQWFFIIAVIAAAIIYVTFKGVDFFVGSSEITVKGIKDLRLGIDIRGGVEAYFQSADPAKKPTAEDLAKARTVLSNKLDNLKILDREISTDSQNGVVLVRFPWKSDEVDFDPQKSIDELGKMQKLTFVDPDGKVVIDGSHVVSASSEYSQGDSNNKGGYYVSLTLNDAGAKLFSDATARLIGKNISIKMDEKVISNPTVKVQITDGKAVIDGMKDATESNTLADNIKAGALPYPMVSKSNSSISPTLGSGALKAMIYAGILAFILVCLFMLFYYRLPGAVACIALAMHTCAQILFLSIPQLTLTLPGIAGLILSIGMGVDANVIIAERIKEELNNGKTLTSAITLGYKRAFSAVFDGNITVVIVAILLMIFGSGSMLSFGYTLLTGVISNLFFGVFCTRLMTTSLSNLKPFRKLGFYGAKGVQQ